jgi:hypothetical protein
MSNVIIIHKQLQNRVQNQGFQIRQMVQFSVKISKCRLVNEKKNPQSKSLSRSGIWEHVQ